ncbi:hypothetical protein GUJ93_ZPchr0004g38720 [Zizania palustris]|uniref:Uncharacterized protein n=1 Tax=Zizania palustris TaxID=103762 RepID=A0A8J5VNV5_ZIZPA|nr:hypothetical protein GUJ93_ZPchr0004g38720 [Zizania palustris]
MQAAERRHTTISQAWDPPEFAFYRSVARGDQGSAIDLLQQRQMQMANNQNTGSNNEEGAANGLPRSVVPNWGATGQLQSGLQSANHPTLAKMMANQNQLITTLWTQMQHQQA